MATLYIDRKDIELRVANGALVFIEPEGKRGSVPVRRLDRVVLHGSVRLDSSVLGALTEAGASVALVGGRRSRYLASCVGRAHNDMVRRLGQFEAFRDVEARKLWSHDLIVAKTAAQQRLIDVAINRRPDQRRLLKRAAGRLLNAQARLASEHPTIATLRGIEGSAAAAYFQGLRACFPGSLGFSARKRRPPPDPVNACLSLGYTLLHAEGVAQCHAAGLDPMIGLFHEPLFGRESLAADVIEPLRPHIDEWVWGLFRDRILTAAAFKNDNGAVMLGKAGRQHFYREFESLRTALSRLLRREVSRIAREFGKHGSAVLRNIGAGDGGNESC